MFYFNYFPKILYDPDGSGNVRIVTNIMKRIRVRANMKKEFTFLDPYDVQDGETPEMVADKIYGDTGLHWVVLLFNDIINPYYDWPLSNRKLESYIKKKYPGKAFFITDESGGIGTFANVHFEKNWTVLGVDGNTYDDLQNITYGQTNAALVYKWDRDLSKIEVTDVSGDFATGDYLVAIGTSADGATYNVGGYLARLVDLNYAAIHHFENSIDKTMLNPLGAPPFGGTGEQAVVGHTSATEGYTYGSSGSNVTYDDTILQNYVADQSSTYVKTNFEYETERNEERRTIRLIRPEYIQRITSEFENLMQGK